MKIVIEVKNVYGELKAYPACKTSQFFCELAGTKTLTHSMLNKIKAQGYEVEQTSAQFAIA